MKSLLATFLLENSLAYMMFFQKKWLRFIHTLLLAFIIWGFLYNIGWLLALGLVGVLMTEGHDLRLSPKIPSFFLSFFSLFYLFIVGIVAYYASTHFTHFFSIRLALMLWLFSALMVFILKVIYEFR